MTRKFETIYIYKFFRNATYLHVFLFYYKRYVLFGIVIGLTISADGKYTCE